MLWASRPAEAPAHQLIEQQIEGTFDDHSQVATRVGVPHQVTCELQLFFQSLARRKLYPISICGERLDPIRLAAPLGSDRRPRRLH